MEVCVMYAAPENLCVDPLMTFFPPLRSQISQKTRSHQMFFTNTKCKFQAVNCVCIYDCFGHFLACFDDGYKEIYLVSLNMSGSLHLNVLKCVF